MDPVCAVGALLDGICGAAYQSAYRENVSGGRRLSARILVLPDLCCGCGLSCLCGWIYASVSQAGGAFQNHCGYVLYSHRHNSPADPARVSLHTGGDVQFCDQPAPYECRCAEAGGDRGFRHAVYEIQRLCFGHEAKLPQCKECGCGHAQSGQFFLHRRNDGVWLFHACAERCGGQDTQGQ